jgi:predicted amidohydrolase YtcJ
MVLLSDDIFSIVPEKIREVRVLKTFVGGRLVFDAAAPGQ